MRPNALARVVESGGVSRTVDFGISKDHTAHIMGILRDSMYSDKVLAAIREYSANAWDAHREAGKGDVPIKVTLPTMEAPTYAVRDFGKGMSEDEVFSIFTQYGYSTKRASDVAVGMLGIGSKAAFAYTDSFNIVCWNDGMKRVYVALIDETEKGNINLLYEEACDPSETGMEIQIAVKEKDIPEFETKACALYKYFDPQPDCNLPLAVHNNVASSLPTGLVFRFSNDGYRRTGEWMALMGCIPYKVDLSQLDAENGKLPAHVRNLSGVINFGIGELEIAASREALKYSDETKKRLHAKLIAHVDEFVTELFRDIESQAKSDWDKRKKFQTVKFLDLPFPEKSKDFSSAYATIPEQEEDKDGNLIPVVFRFLDNKGKTISSIDVNRHEAIYLRDDDRTLSGFATSYSTVIVSPAYRNKMPKVKEELKKVMEQMRITGMPIRLLSELNWTSGTKGKKKYPNHSAKNFVLTKSQTNGFYYPYSKYWTKTDREQTDEDVYVVFREFYPDWSFFTTYQEDVDAFKVMGVDVPPIYGYKDSELHPRDMSKVKGLEYREWRKKVVPKLIPKKFQSIANDYEWGRYIEVRHTKRSKIVGEVETAIKALGKRHPLSNHLRQMVISFRRGQKVKIHDGTLERIGLLLAGGEEEKGQCQMALEKVTENYPLLKVYGLDSLWGEHMSKWMVYVRGVDKIMEG